MKLIDKNLIVREDLTYAEVYERTINNKEFYRTAVDTLKFIGNVSIEIRSLLTDAIRCRTISIENANLEPITLANCTHLSHCWVFKNCNLNRLTIDRVSYAHDIKLYNCNVDKLVIINSNLFECNFSQLKYKDITIQRTKFDKCYFKKVNLSRLDFNINDVKFINCSFISADLCNTNWKATNEIIVSHKFNKANLSNINFNSINLTGSTFNLAKLDNTNFSNCDLHQCNFEETILKDCDLSETNCYKTCFKDSILKRCNLRRASIDWAKFKNTKLIDTYLTNAYYTLKEDSINHFGCSAIDLLKLYSDND